MLRFAQSVAQTEGAERGRVELTGDSPRRRILLKDVALRASVSGSTASRALADDPRISLATRLSVKAAAAELQYVPNAAARSLRVRRTRTLGLLLPDLRDPVHGQVASAFEQEARQQGYSVMVVAGERDVVRERLALRIFAEHGTDGVAIVSSVLAPRELRERVDPARLILVWPDHRSLPRHDGPPDAGGDPDRRRGRRACGGHPPRRQRLPEDRLRREWRPRLEFDPCRDGRHDPPESRDPRARSPVLRAPWMRGAPRPSSPQQIAADLPEALVCYDDQLALALMNALRDLGVRVPDDVGIVGFDGIPYAAMSNPRLTTVAVPSAEMGRVAAVSLIRAVHDGVLPEGVVLPVGVVVRESTRGGPPPSGDG